MMDYIARGIKHFRPRIDADALDRLFYKYTPSMLVFCAFLVSTRQYVGQPIQCWVPAQFTEAMEQYTENYCWVQNTYWLSTHDKIPTEHISRKDAELSYYQWTAFILLGKAVLMFVPWALWRVFSSMLSETNLDIISQLSTECLSMEARFREKNTELLAQYIQGTLTLQRQRWPKWPSWLSNRLTVLYVSTKTLCLASAIIHVFLLNKILSTKQAEFSGWTVMSHLMRGNEWTDSGFFPRVTLCDFDIRVLGNMHRYTVQCVLMINLFNEKIFIFLWFWYLFLAFVCLLNLAHWLVRCVYTKRRLVFLTQLLTLFPSALSDEVREVCAHNLHYIDDFTVHYLRLDGYFMLKMISINCGHVVASQLACQLWNDFLTHCGKMPATSTDRDNRPTKHLSSPSAEAKQMQGSSAHMPMTHAPRFPPAIHPPSSQASVRVTSTFSPSSVNQRLPPSARANPRLNRFVGLSPSARPDRNMFDRRGEIPT